MLGIGQSTVHFPFTRSPLQYASCQPKPTFNVEVLVKPYDWKSWLVALVALIIMALILSIQSSASCGGLIDSLYSLLRISLNQPYEGKSERTINSSDLITWVLASMILSEAYKGKILFFLTNPTGVQTPSSLNELLSIHAYKLFNFETISTPT